MKEITVCIVDDNIILCNCLEDIIDNAEGFNCVGRFLNADEAIANIPALRPDVVLMDINLGPGETGIDCVRVLKPFLHETNFMMCTVYDDNEKIFEALRAGANGYILKKTEPARLLSSIRELYEGGSPISSEIAKKVVLAFQEQPFVPNSDINSLSKREREILSLLSQGMMYKEIAYKLFLSIETIRKHVYHVYGKLHVNNRVAAVNKFYGRG